MKSVRHALAVLGSLLVVVGLAAVLAPERTHALVATLVQVVNNVPVVNPVDGNGNPIAVITKDVDSPVHSAFNIDGSCNFGWTNGLYGCYISPLLSVPAGQVAKIEYASAFCDSSGADVRFVALVNGTSVGQQLTVPNYALPPNTGFGQTTGFYIVGTSSTDPLTNGHLNAILRGDSSTTGGCWVSVSGYLAPQ